MCSSADIYLFITVIFLLLFFICRLHSHGSIVAFLNELCGPDRESELGE